MKNFDDGTDNLKNVQIVSNGDIECLNEIGILLWANIYILRDLMQIWQVFLYVICNVYNIRLCALVP